MKSAPVLVVTSAPVLVGGVKSAPVLVVRSAPVLVGGVKSAPVLVVRSAPVLLVRGEAGEAVTGCPCEGGKVMVGRWSET